jgi:RNA polymerase-binding transcription factor DksA
VIALIVSGRVTRQEPRPGAIEMNATKIESDELVMCDTCGWELSADEVETLGDECRTCYAKRHFECTKCTDAFELVDECKAHPGHCESCGEAIDIERLDALKDALQAAIDRIVDQGNAGRITRVLAAMRSIR